MIYYEIASGCSKKKKRFQIVIVRTAVVIFLITNSFVYFCVQYLRRGSDFEQMRGDDGRCVLFFF